jgi:hypothetical protein
VEQEHPKVDSIDIDHSFEEIIQKILQTIAKGRCTFMIVEK